MIDERELYVGTHVLHKGKRFLLERIYGALVGFNTDTDDDGVPGIISITSGNVIDPIPITLELLEELGFEKVEEHGAVSIWQHPANVTIAIYGERISLTIGYKLAINSIRYLHELEAFVYMTTKKELIKD